MINRFKSDLEQLGKLNKYRSRAAALDPVMPWMVLALYHRGMLQKVRLDRAKIMHESMKILSKLHSRFTLQNKGIVAGCGWGRFANLLIPFLNKGNYFGLDVHHFELRALIQLEIGVEGGR